MGIALGIAGPTGATGSVDRLIAAGTATTAIQSELDAGPGTVTLDEGDHTLTDTVYVPKGVHFKGQGEQATFVRMANGINKDCIQSDDFAALTGTDVTNSNIFGWSITGMTVEGNKENNTSGRGIAVYGIGTIRDVEVRDCAGIGVWSEWGSGVGWRAPFADATGYGPESTMDNVRTIFCNGGGIEWRGPTDARWNNCTSAFCGPVDGSGEAVTTPSTTYGFNVNTRGQGLQAVACHSYGVNQKAAIRSAVGSYWEGCVAEGAQDAQVIFSGTANHWCGGQVFGVPPDHDDAVGFQIGEAGLPAAGTIIDGARITNTIEGSISFVNDSGNGRYQATIYQASGTAVVGTQGGNSLFPNFFDLHVSGGALPGVMLAASARPVLRGKKSIPLNVVYGEANGLLSATFDAAMAPPSAEDLATGFLFVQRHMVPFTTTFANLLLYVNNGGSGLTYARGGLYSAAGTLLAKTADQTTGWTSAGLKTMALTAEAGQSLTVQGGEGIWVYTAEICTGTTAPGLWDADSTKNDLTNALLDGTTGLRAGKSGSGVLTSLASSLVAVGADPWMFWAGLS